MSRSVNRLWSHDRISPLQSIGKMYLQYSHRSSFAPSEPDVDEDGDVGGGGCGREHLVCGAAAAAGEGLAFKLKGEVISFWDICFAMHVFLALKELQKNISSVIVWLSERVQSVPLWMTVQPFLLYTSFLMQKNGWTTIHSGTFCISLCKKPNVWTLHHLHVPCPSPALTDIVCHIVSED